MIKPLKTSGFSGFSLLPLSFPKPAYKPLAIKIIYALSVHRLTTNGLDVQFGLTAENLKDDLCLYLMMPEQDADFLLGVVKATLRDIMTTVSGQFIICNEANNQYYIDVDKVVDYDEKIKQNPICPHCRYSLEDKAKNVYGQLDNLEDRIDALVAEWTKQLMDTITDPIVLSQKEYLSAQQAMGCVPFRNGN